MLFLCHIKNELSHKKGAYLNAIKSCLTKIIGRMSFSDPGHHKCRERWPNGDYERVYNLFLDLLLLVVPLLALAVTYYLIAVTLWRDLARRPG